MLAALLVPIIIASLFYCGILIRAAIQRGAVPDIEAVALGTITNFFDTLGIGSFAPTTAWLKFRGMVADRLIPCTMIVNCGPCDSPAEMNVKVIAQESVLPSPA